MAKKQILLSKKTDIVKRKVKICGLRDIMFDRYAGDNNTKLEADQKLYLDSQNHITLPSMNIMSLLTAHNTNSAPKRFRDIRQYKKICNAILSFLSIDQQNIIFTSNGKPVKFKGFNKDDVCPQSNVYIRYDVARLEKGIPNPKKRPVLPTPWELEFDLQIFPNNEIQEQEIVNIFRDAGIAIGLGTFRGVFGKFEILNWD